MLFKMMNMCEIYDTKNNCIVVLDKVKKYGWEGLTYPGGHLELGESIIDSVCREVKEETGLTIHTPQYVGAIHWITENINEHLIALLYRTTSFSGELIPENKEGKLSWMPYNKFIESNKSFSDSMEDILNIYNGTYKEILSYYTMDENKKYKYLYTKKQK